MIEFWKRADQVDAAFRSEELLGLTSLRAAHLKLFQRSENLINVECDACGDRHIERVHIFPGQSGNEPRAYIACKDAGRVRVELERLEIQRIDFSSLTRIISTIVGLGISPRCLIDGRLWFLGSCRLVARHRDVFIVRGSAWPDGLSLAEHPRILAAPCPLILVPDLIPSDTVWTSDERLVLSMSEFDWFGDASQNVLERITSIVAEHDRKMPSTEDVFRQVGDVWLLSFDAKVVHVADTLGMGYLAELLRKPRVAIEAAQLAGVSVETTQLAAIPGIPLADDKAIKAVREDLIEKKIQQLNLEKSDWVRKGELQDQIAQLEKYLGEVQTNEGKPRITAGTAQRSRTSVTNAINRAIDNISKHHPDLGCHLKKSIRKGIELSYEPVQLSDWRF